MRVGFHLGYWGAGIPPGTGEAVAAAESLGLDSVWTAEAYGSDALTPLAWWGSRTRSVRLGTCVAQMAARSPAATAMAAMTLDHLSGGRFELGLGVSGPQVVEGWHGQPFDHPLARTREYVAIVRDIIARRGPVTADGEFYPLPYRRDARTRASDGGGVEVRPADDPAAAGQQPPAAVRPAPGAEPPGSDPPAAAALRPLRSTLHPLRPDLPIHLAAEGPRNIALAGEIADGWLPLFYAPRLDAEYRALLAEGFAERSPQLRPASRFEVGATVPVVLDDDVARAADRVRPFLALYVGGMGTARANFHHDVVTRLGFADAADEIRSRYLAGDKAGAAAAVPQELIDDVALVGPPERVQERFAAWRGSSVTRIIVSTDPAMLPEVARLLVE